MSISRRLDRGENLVVGIDSIGLRICGEGEWKVHKYGWSKHRTWRKLHICENLIIQEILSVELTGNDEDDASVRASMLKKKTGIGDKVRQIIPPSKNGVVTLPKQE